MRHRTLGLWRAPHPRRSAPIAADPGRHELNLAVSFGCSLAIAWHARKPQLRRGHAMTSAVVRSLVAEGAGLLLPVGRTAREAASTEPPSRR
ncbi:MAG: hypothetical protein JNL21_20950 [Myxococcales bacterium]|nr:hypothetical protein [Myxococcales bacterium]